MRWPTIRERRARRSWPQPISPVSMTRLPCSIEPGSSSLGADTPSARRFSNALELLLGADVDPAPLGRDWRLGLLAERATDAGRAFVRSRIGLGSG